MAGKRIRSKIDPIKQQLLDADGAVSRWNPYGNVPLADMQFIPPEKTSDDDEDDGYDNDPDWIP